MPNQEFQSELVKLGYFMGIFAVEDHIARVVSP
jgi:hypothetical protein